MNELERTALNEVLRTVTYIDDEKGEKKVESVEIVELIKIAFKRGKGTEDDPIRVVTQYWDKENILIFEKD